jgi:hypothetical protein
MIIINLNKAKVIAHDKRRTKRAEEFAPLDEKIMKQIPGTDAKAIESQRQAIRDKYAVIQEQIDQADSVEALKQILISQEIQ